MEIPAPKAVQEELKAQEEAKKKLESQKGPQKLNDHSGRVA